jgi:hypothetical protein
MISLLLVVFTASCTSMHKVNVEKNESVLATVAIGDKVEVVTFEGKYYQFVVETMTKDKIGGEGFTFLTADIAELRKEEFSYALMVGSMGVMLVVSFYYLFFEALATFPFSQ